MLNQKERAESRAICDAATKQKRDDIRDQAEWGNWICPGAVIDLLDALDGMETRMAHFKDCYDISDRALKRVAADRDQWKARAVRAEADYEKARNHATNLTARAEALERAVRIWAQCPTCKHIGNMALRCNLGALCTGQYWQFDQERFMRAESEGADG